MSGKKPGINNLKVILAKGKNNAGDRKGRRKCMKEKH